MSNKFNEAATGLEALLPGLEFSRETHVQWRDCDQSCRDKNPSIGDAAFHAGCVKEYDERINAIKAAVTVLCDASTGIAAMTEVMTLDQREQDIINWIGEVTANGSMSGAAANKVREHFAAIKARDARVAAVVMPDWKLSEYNAELAATQPPAQPVSVPQRSQIHSAIQSDIDNLGFATIRQAELDALCAAPLPPAQPEFDEDQAADHAREYFTQQFKDHLNPATACLVWNFALALGNKLADAEKKYGYTDGWRSTDWMDECRAKLLEHVAKGDPRDVAAYCAFLWHHGERTAAQPEPASADAEDAARPKSEWHEDYGPVVWWAWCGAAWAGEPAWIGTPNDSDWPGYHTHWTPHPAMPPLRDAARAAKGGG